MEMERVITAAQELRARREVNDDSLTGAVVDQVAPGHSMSRRKIYSTSDGAFVSCEARSSRTRATATWSAFVMRWSCRRTSSSIASAS
jgi:hypothetical protein